MDKFVNKLCNKCNEVRSFRLRGSNKQNPYYTCTVCTSNNDKKTRINNWWAYLARKANARKLEGSEVLTKEIIIEIAEKQNYKCALTEQNLDPKDKWWKPSLDRIDSNLPYIKSNIRIVAWIVNHCRGDLTDEEFIDMCKKVSKCEH